MTEINNLIDKSKEFFFKEDTTDFQKAILSALYWYGRIDVTFDNSIIQYISYINGLERLILFDTKNNKTDKFGARISNRFPIIDKEIINKLYAKRNEILHEREPDIYR